MNEGSFFSIVSQILVTYYLIDNNIIIGMRVYLIVVLICIFLITSEVKHLFAFCWPFVCLLERSVCSGRLPMFLLDYSFIVVVELYAFSLYFGY